MTARSGMRLPNDEHDLPSAYARKGKRIGNGYIKERSTKGGRLLGRNGREGKESLREGWVVLSVKGSSLLCVLLGPFTRHLDGGSLVGLVVLCDVVLGGSGEGRMVSCREAGKVRRGEGTHSQRVIGVGSAQKSLDGEEDGSDLECWGPFVYESGERMHGQT
jgi:hypothetical protein